PDAPKDEDVKANNEVSDAGSVKEEDGATLTYSVKLSKAVGSDVEVDLTTGGDATRGSDYENTLQYSTDGGTTWLDVPATGKVTLPADGSSVLVKVTVKDDAITENDETVTLTATTTDAQITTKTATGTGTILDDRGSDNPDVDEDVPVITRKGSKLSENCLYYKSDAVDDKDRESLSG
ncbi:Calx-beta domain-containing protein, partial [Aliarcobacter skirrowii]